MPKSHLFLVAIAHIIKANCSHGTTNTPITKKTNNTTNQQNSQKDNVKNILNDLNMDSDKALILSLILLLTEEKADEMLILALLYILS